MNVLVVGSGGREHAMAWQMARSPHVTRLWVAPGNGGTAVLRPLNQIERVAENVAQSTAGTSPAGTTGGEQTNVPIAADDVPGLVTFAREQAVDLVVIGPEVPLAAGLVDALDAAGIRAFGPPQAAARLESSKAWAKDFMRRHGIPTARYACFERYEDALKHLLGVDYPVVIKASGLAAGKGVIVPSCADEAEAALREVMVERAFGAAGDTVVVEERISGPEVSLMAFVDGETVVPMPPAQDHKRLLDGDQGPNTGGMGAICPAPICPPDMVEQLTRSVLIPTVRGLRDEGIVYRGVLYAGIMLTEQGPMVLEFNCRFGDPETECILPLLQGDLFEICTACVQGTLAQQSVRWRSGTCVTIVLASEGYPGPYPKGRVIMGADETDEELDLVVFHAGTRRVDNQVLTDGGRVLAVSALGENLEDALNWAYLHLPRIHFEGMQFRRDIGARAR